MLHLIDCLALLAQTVLAGRSAAQGSDMLRSSSCCGATPQSLGRVMASPWQPSEVPNPNSQHARCNILGPGGLCDPDGILSPHGKNRILEVLTAIRQETSLTCPDGKEHGYQMAVLLVQQMDRSSDVLKGLSIEKASEQFATEVGKMWKVGDKGCNNGIMMFLSIWDRFAYIKTTDTTQNILSDSDARQVVHNMRPLLRDERYHEAILQGVVQVKGALMGNHIRVKGALMGNHIRNDKGLNLFQSCVLGVILAFLFICLVFHSFFMCLVGCLYVVLVTLLCLPMAVIADALTACCHRKKQISRIEQAQAQEDLQRVAKELDRDEFDQTICPICLDHLEDKSSIPSENFQVDTSRGVLLPFNGVGFPMKGEHGQETKTLQCKHKYHKQCVEEWLVQHSSCPLCRSDVSDVSLADEDAKQPESYQRRLRFYLSRVQANHRSVFGSFNTFYGTFDPPLMYQRHASTGQVCVSDWYLNGYGYESGYLDSFHSHLASAQTLVMDWAEMSVHGFGGGGGFDFGGGGFGGGGFGGGDFGGGGGFDGGGGGGGGW